MNNPLVSVVIPTRNRLQMLQEAIESVRRQNYPNWDLIVVDDCSEDETWAWLSSLRDPRIRTVRLERHSERSMARNRGLAEARGEYVFFLDDDDLLLSHALDRLARALEENSSAVAVQCGWIYFGAWEGVPPWPHRKMVRDVFWDAFYGVPLGGAGVLYRSDVLHVVGGLYEGLTVGEDRVGGLRIAAQGPYVILPDRLRLMRTRAGHSWDEVELQRSYFAAQRELTCCAPLRHRRRVPGAVVALSHFVYFHEALAAGRRWRALRSLARTIRADPALARAHLLWRVVGPGFLRALLPARSRSIGRKIQRLMKRFSQRTGRSLGMPGYYLTGEGLERPLTDPSGIHK